MRNEIVAINGFAAENRKNMLLIIIIIKLNLIISFLKELVQMQLVADLEPQLCKYCKDKVLYILDSEANSYKLVFSKVNI